jgi:hypothetical protein
MRPSLVELHARDNGDIDVIWKVAYARGAPLPLTLELPERCQRRGDVTRDATAAVLTRRWRVDCRVSEQASSSGLDPLDGFAFAVRGLEVSQTEVIARVFSRAGESRTRVLRAASPAWSLAANDMSRETGGAGPGLYLRVGVEHILGGPDHLLFVLGLVLLVLRGREGEARWDRGRARALFAAISAFTLAHSVTLALAVLGVVQVARGAVEAIIALSILLLATELARVGARANTWTSRAPWVVAFVCGLVHGFGFAGALAQLGLPEDALARALLLFNLGVELGQLAFVAVIVVAGIALTRFVSRPALALRVTTYAVGTCAAYWLFDRLGLMFL